MIDEGVIKYSCEWVLGEKVDLELIQSLIRWRNYIHQLGLIGVYDNGIGFGNISIRISDTLQFIISGSQTGHLPQLEPEHYTVVTDFNIEQNHLTCCGPIQASSESLTHAAIYSIQPQINAIIHVHHPQLWQHLLYQIPTTRQQVKYGTPAMAAEMFRLFAEENLSQQKILVMAGHEDGLLTFGKDLNEAGEILMQYYNFSIGSSILKTSDED
ncbi:MAG TPA: class II aldolase/adducin family protein [Candidatus Obscuribacterales bacterium]